MGNVKLVFKSIMKIKGSSFFPQSLRCVENGDPPKKSLGNGWKLLLTTSRH